EVAVTDGAVVNANLSDYPVPSCADLPTRLTHDLLEREGAEIHGLGETALPPVPPAIGNAVASLGIPVTHLPLTPERVLEAAELRVEARAWGSPCTRWRRAPTSRCFRCCVGSSV